MTTKRTCPPYDYTPNPDSGIVHVDGYLQDLILLVQSNTTLVKMILELVERDGGAKTFLGGGIGEVE